MGAGIFCVVCGARPYPELGPPGTREDFDLIRLDRDGAPAESPAPGEWFCLNALPSCSKNLPVSFRSPHANRKCFETFLILSVPFGQ